MTDQQAAQHQAQQAELYGAPLGDLMRQIMQATGLTQGALAGVLGLSAPMLSQLMSGRRVKIGNPVVVDRLEQLLELTHGDVPQGEALQARLEDIRASQRTLTHSVTVTRSSAVQPVGAPECVAHLRTLAGADELRQASDAVAALGGPGTDAVAALLRAASSPSTSG